MKIFAEHLEDGRDYSDDYCAGDGDSSWTRREWD